MYERSLYAAEKTPVRIARRALDQLSNSSAELEAHLPIAMPSMEAS